MYGRDVFMESLLAHGVQHMFGNPGTTESPLIDSLARYQGIEYVLALHEGVAIGAASYYAQACGRAGVVNLHVAPGLGNAIGMIFGALRTNSPMVVTAGQQDTRLRLRDPILGHDLVAMAAPVVKWSVQAESADEIAPIVRRAFKIAHDAPSGPVFIALPINVMEQQTEVEARAAGPLWRAPPPDPDGVAAMARLLLAASEPAIMIGDDVARTGAGEALVALAEATGAGIWTELIHQHQPVPNMHPNYRGRIPTDPATIAKTFGGADAVLMVGGPFFEEVWYAPSGPFPPGAKVLHIEESTERLARNHGLDAGLIAGLKPALEALCAQVEAERSDAYAAEAEERNRVLAAFAEKERGDRLTRLDAIRERRPMPVPIMLEALATAVPEDVVIVEEAITGSPEIPKAFSFGGHGRLLLRPRRRHLARGSPARSASIWRCRSARWSASRATARRCTASRRSGPRRTTGCPSSSSSSPTPSTASSSTISTSTGSASASRRTTLTYRWTWSIRLWASSRWRPGWASPAPASPSPTSWPRR